MGEVRYSSLAKSFPGIAEELFVKTEKDDMERLASFVKSKQIELIFDTDVEEKINDCNPNKIEIIISTIVFQLNHPRHACDL